MGSPNPVKLKAVEIAFSHYFEDVNVLSVNVPSGVKALPDSEDLIIEGARNRAVGAFKPDLDFSVGIEGGVVLLYGRWYDRNYVVVYDGERKGIGTSSSYEVPVRLVDGVDSTSDESKKIIDSELGEEDVFTRQGVIGVFTRNVIDRERLLADAVVCALTRFLNPEHYKER